MQQQVEGAPAKVQLMGSIDALLADESEEMKIRVGSIAASLDGITCAGLMAMAEATRRGVLLQRAQEQAAAAAAGAPTAAGEDTQATIFRRLPCSSRHAAHIEAGNHKEAAVVVGCHHVATFAHQGHQQWALGTQVQVGVHDPAASHRTTVGAEVVLIDTDLDLALLKVEKELEAPPLSFQLFPGQRYFVLGQSAQAQPDEASVSHARIAATEPDPLNHVRGDIPAGAGDSGAGAFSVDTGALIGMVVGADHHTNKAILLPSAIISSKIMGVR